MYCLNCRVLQSRGLKAKHALQCLIDSNELGSYNPQLCEHALYKLTRYYETVPDYFVIQPIHLLRDIIKRISNHRFDNTNRLMRKVTVTPLRIIFQQPERMDENRLIRHFDSDYMLNIWFRDENDSMLNGIETLNNDDTFFVDTISKRLLKGLKLGNRHYYYLGGSNSQLREHGCCMYAKDDRGNTCDTIRQWVGDLNSIRCVAQYVARLGLAFSQTDSKIVLKKEQIQHIPDIEHGRDVNGKPYCFTDGVGMISQQLAKRVYISHLIPMMTNILHYRSILKKILFFIS